MKRIVLHVDRLVLNGFDGRDRQRIAAELQGELARLLAEPGAAQRLAALGAVERLRAGPAPAAHGAEPASAGVAAARAIAGGLSR